MRSLAPYLVISALVLAWTLRGGPLSWEEVTRAVPLSYIYFVLPQICWFGIARFMDVSAVVRHAGLLGATAPLVGLTIAFDCCFDNSNALGWLYYWPAALVGIIVLVCGALLVSRVQHKNA